MSGPFKMKGWSPFTQKPAGTKKAPGPSGPEGIDPKLLELSNKHDALDEKIFNLRQDNKEVPDSLVSQRAALGAQIDKLMNN